ncbi:adenylate/guanylate cyclase domain-containing protein [Mycolicibacterium gilvum]|uniref:Family 3 adenylate cyclase n=1 Tax=Mycolicibacterium gilvum (strain DSM 45189 / LMG 24558 / Spyr1) TaxID=278137 RepID=E6TJ93_MYCSR|nr:adenylate/guanylate cyclase domain-containing protein [Mycolicibacterium gilvum]ADT99170.1 family 3 adenylate cyclase [Mycolicibacterium gilvum Spyr1]
MYPSIESTVNEIFKAAWNIAPGIAVPKTEDIVLKNGGRLLDATYAYADLGGSTKLIQSNLYKETVAKIIRAYINSATRIFRQYDGKIRSFDGDRVMAIFVGEDKNTRATRAALAINWAVEEIIPEAIKTSWSDGQDFCKITHRVGIDTGEALIVRGGVRDNNDLISIGSAPNVAAKLSDLKDGYAIYIAKAVRDDLDDEVVSFANANGTVSNIWYRFPHAKLIGDNSIVIYGTKAYWGL